MKIYKDDDPLDSFLSEFAYNITSTKKMPVCEFAKEVLFNGSERFQLFPTQKAILKSFYNEPLTDEERSILQGWKDEDRTTWVEDRHYISLVLEAGRRASKCNAEFARIHTTVGNITYKELHERLSNNERIGIQTYDLKKKTLYTTYDIKTELNEIEEVFEVVTENNKVEITNSHHPYYKWYDNTTICNWVELRQLQPGNNIAVSNYINVWGDNSLTEKEITYISLILSLSKKEDVYKFRKTTKKEVRPLFKKNKNVLVSNNYIKLKDVPYENLINPEVINGLSKESTITLLTEFCKLSYFMTSFSKGIEFICNNSNRNLIRSLFFKLGINTKIINKGLKISEASSLLNLFNTIGWDFSGDEVELREYVGSIQFNQDMPKTNEEKAEEVFGHKDIHFEKIKHIKSLGVHQTIALEVKDTHVIANEIVSHNSTMSSIICLKEFYDLITLDSPAEHYGMFPGSPLSILVLAQSKAQVKDTIFSAIRGYAEGSLYFKNMHKRGEIQILSEEIRCPSKNVAIYAKHTRTEALVGYTIKCLILDEVARFQSVGEDGRNKAFEIWKNVATGGAGFKEHFKKVAISSAWEPGDPIEVLYEEGKNSTLTLGFKLTTFQVNLDLIKGVTPSVVQDYETDFVKARREFEGIRFNKFNSFIDKTRLEKATTGFSCLDATPTPIDIGEGEDVRKYAGVQINRLAKQKNTEELSFVHIDPALKKDSAGLAIATPVKTEDDGKWKIRLDGFIKWEPHTDERGFKRIVSFLNIETILDQLIEKRNIRRITFDQYNSESFIQRLHSMGIDSQQVSCTRDAQFSYYMLFRDLLNHDYIILPKDSLWTGDVITELSELILKPNKQIIHPYAGKDMADAVVNAVFQAHQYMIRSGMQMNYGMGATVAKGGILPKITLTNTDNLKIGSARDKLYKNILK